MNKKEILKSKQKKALGNTQRAPPVSEAKKITIYTFKVFRERTTTQSFKNIKQCSRETTEAGEGVGRISSPDLFRSGDPRRNRTRVAQENDTKKVPRLRILPRSPFESKTERAKNNFS